MTKRYLTTITLSALAGIAVAVAGITISSCTPYYSQENLKRTTPTYQEQWAHDKDLQPTLGYSGAFACHTPDGGCLHMACNTKASCDYMAEAEKRCGTPAQLNKLTIVEDDTCKSTEAATSYPSSTVSAISNGNVYTYTGGGWRTTESTGR
jgi:hypothetical protein